MDKGLERALLIKEQAVIQAWLKNNDWKFKKVLIGEWEETDTRWVEYKEQRAVKRARLDSIKKALGI